MCFLLPPPLPPFPPPNQKSPSNLHLEVSLDNFQKMVWNKNLLLLEWFDCDSSLSLIIRVFVWVFFKTCSRPFHIHSSKLMQLHLGNIFHCFLFSWNHGCSWRSHDNSLSPANYETSVDWSKKNAGTLISIVLVHKTLNEQENNFQQECRFSFFPIVMLAWLTENSVMHPASGC